MGDPYHTTYGRDRSEIRWCQGEKKRFLRGVPDKKRGKSPSGDGGGGGYQKNVNNHWQGVNEKLGKKGYRKVLDGTGQGDWGKVRQQKPTKCVELKKVPGEKKQGRRARRGTKSKKNGTTEGDLT